MKIIVVGGTGATGRHFVNELLSHGNKVTAIVRNTEMIDTYFKNKAELSPDEIGTQTKLMPYGYKSSMKGTNNDFSKK